ncbi:MAG: fibronectin type III domain-containing protein, partial [Thermoleophilaceae bacterium]
MTNRIRGTHVVALAVFAIAAPAASADPATVNLRVEAQGSTLFDAPLTTDGHNVTTPSGGTHKCDSTNGNPPANPTPGPSATAALDDGAKLAGFDFDGTYNSGFDDFFIERIGPNTNSPAKFWGLFVNSVSSSVGGCQQRAGQGDEVLWAYAAFGAAPLKLSGPPATTPGQSVQVRVTHGESGAPEPGATVGGATTGADGTASLSFADSGIYRLKADRSDAIRSNTHVLCVDPAGADPCTSGDKNAPRVVRIDLPGRELASERGQSRTMVISWQAEDGAGAGVAYYAVEVREMASGLRSAKIVPGEWKLITDRTAAPSVRFRGDSAKAYQFRVTAVDRAANRGAADTDPIVVPVDDRDRRLWRFSRGWKRTPRRGAWGRTVRRTTKAGATARLPFTGRRVSLIGRRLPKGGRLRVSVGGRSKVLRLRGRSAPRRVLWTSRGLRDGAH